MKPPHSVISLWGLPAEIERSEKELAEIQAKDESEFPDHNPYVRKQGRIEEVQNRLTCAQTTWKEGWRSDVKRRLGKALDRIDRDYSEEMQSHDVYREMEEIAEKMNTLEQSWRQSYKAIENAGQLFIAVSGVWK